MDVDLVLKHGRLVSRQRGQQTLDAGDHGRRRGGGGEGAERRDGEAPGVEALGRPGQDRRSHAVSRMIAQRKAGQQRLGGA